MLIAPALAQEYPVKPLRLMVPYPAGSSRNENHRAPPRDGKGLKSPARELTYHPVPDIA